MPSSSTSGWSRETSRLKIGFSQMDRPTPCPYWRAKAASSFGKPNSSGPRPHRDDVGGGRPRLHQGDGLVHVVAAADVGVAHGRGRAADREAAVVAGPVAVVAVQDVEEGGSPGRRMRSE